MQEVTDPELLKQLNAGNSQEVTDPALLAQLNGEQEKPGLLKSLGYGALSGIPGAETALSAVRAIDPNTTFEQAHQGIEAAKDAAWDAHPVAYGAGKTAGLVGTGIVAPEGLIGAGVVGAASGLDAAERPADMLEDAAKGAGTGLAFGAAAKGVGKLLDKALPAAGKAAVASLGAPTREDVEAYLANPENINGALDKTQMANKLADTVNGLSSKTDEMSGAARNLINPESTPLQAAIPATSGSAPTAIMGQTTNELGEMVPQKTVVTHGPPVNILGTAAPTEVDTLKPVFDQLKSRYLQNGVPKSAEAQSAINALDKQYERLAQIARANGGKLSEEDLKNQIVELQNIARNTFGEGTDVTASKGALRNLSGALNAELKTSNPEYAKAIEPVAENKSLIGDISDKFKLNEDNGQFSPTDATTGKMSNLIGDKKPESQEYLEHLKNLTGVDFLDLAKNADIANRFNNPAASQGASVLSHSLGYAAGALSGVPGGRLIGSLIGGTIGHNVDGGRMAKSILDSYLKFRGGAMNTALQKYGGILANAAKQGGNQLAATHFVLSTSDPAYGELVKQHQEAGMQEEPEQQ